jgi:tyrosine-protein kinase Etk/Wzc
MRTTDDIKTEYQTRKSAIPLGFDPKTIISLLKRKWYWLVLGLITGVYGSRVYISHTLPIYETTATILINEADNRPIVDNTELLQGLGLPGGMQNIENQMLILKSRELIERTLQVLPFNIEFYFKTFRNVLPIYPDVPLRLGSQSEIPLPRDTEFLIRYIGENQFRLVCESKRFPINKTAFFGDTITIDGRNGEFWIDCRDKEWWNSVRDRSLCLKIHNVNYLVNNYGNRLSVELISRGGSILRISLKGTNPEKDADFINEHLKGFQVKSVSAKNMEADRRIQFIDNQLVGISDSLSLTENRLQQFRSAHRVMDLSLQGQSIIGQVTLLENEKARLNLEANYYDYLADYLMKDIGDLPIVPITMGITDPGLTRLVEELADHQRQLSVRGIGEMNPVQRSLEQKARLTKDALKETLNGLRRANNLARSENQEQINRANAQASALPATERQLLGYERKFKLNDELYTFLLEIRAEQQMQKASNKADNETVDKADERYSYILSPIPIRVQFIGIFAGLSIPFLLIFLNLIFKTKLDYEDIQLFTNIPVVGNIPRSLDDSNLVVLENPSSSIAEAYRLMRSKMQFFTKQSNCPVILITSSMPTEGKTFTAINLASAYSLLGKKTILLGFDLRIPKIYKDFNLHNDSGISTWLIGKDKIENLIQKTSYDNLWIIPSGPVPPNPSELIALEKTRELFEILREKFDYIILDTSPIGFVSDTFHLASHADACILVVRPGTTIKELFESTLHEISGLNGLSLVINDIKTAKKYYGYGERYGYTKDNEKSRRISFRKKLAAKISD